VAPIDALRLDALLNQREGDGRHVLLAVVGVERDPAHELGALEQPFAEQSVEEALVLLLRELDAVGGTGDPGS